MVYSLCILVTVTTTLSAKALEVSTAVASKFFKTEALIMEVAVKEKFCWEIADCDSKIVKAKGFQQ